MRCLARLANPTEQEGTLWGPRKMAAAPVSSTIQTPLLCGVNHRPNPDPTAMGSSRQLRPGNLPPTLRGSLYLGSGVGRHAADPLDGNRGRRVLFGIKVAEARSHRHRTGDQIDVLDGSRDPLSFIQDLHEGGWGAAG